MPIIASAKKALKRSKKLQERNLQFKHAMKKAVKEFTRAYEQADKKTIEDLYAKVVSTVDKAARKNIIHQNTAARRKQKFTKMMHEVLGK